MLLKNQSGQGVYLFAYIISTGLPDTGDGANITGYYSLDDGAATVFATANPTELSATHMKGVYWQPLATAETNGNAFAYSWSSSTSGIGIVPLIGFTSGVNLPVAAPGAAGGQFIAGTNAATTVTTAFTTTFTGNLTGSVNSVTTAVPITSNLKKNTALNGFEFPLVLSSDHVSPATGKTVTATVSLNGGSYGATTNAATEVGNGTYTINLAAADVNGNTVTLQFTATGCDTTFVYFVTQP